MKPRKQRHLHKYDISAYEDFQPMKMTYIEAITRFNALSELEKGKSAEKPYDLPWEMWVLTTTMMNALQPYVDGYQKGRTARFKRATEAGGVRRDQFEQPGFVDPKAELAFRSREERILNSEINILMPVSKLELKIKDNNYPPTLLVRLKGLYEEPQDKSAKFEMETGEASPVPDYDEDDDDGDKAKVLRHPSALPGSTD